MNLIKNVVRLIVKPDNKLLTYKILITKLIKKLIHVIVKLDDTYKVSRHLITAMVSLSFLEDFLDVIIRLQNLAPEVGFFQATSFCIFLSSFYYVYSKIADQFVGFSFQKSGVL